MMLSKRMKSKRPPLLVSSRTICSASSPSLASQMNRLGQRLSPSSMRITILRFSDESSCHTDTQTQINRYELEEEADSLRKGYHDEEAQGDGLEGAAAGPDRRLDDVVVDLGQGAVVALHGREVLVVVVLAAGAQVLDLAQSSEDSLGRRHSARVHLVAAVELEARIALP